MDYLLDLAIGFVIGAIAVTAYFVFFVLKWPDTQDVSGKIAARRIRCPKCGVEFSEFVGDVKDAGDGSIHRWRPEFLATPEPLTRCIVCGTPVVAIAAFRALCSEDCAETANSMEWIEANR